MGLIALAAAAGGCRASSGPEAAEPAPALVMNVAFAQPASCRVDISGSRFSLPAEEALLLEGLRRQAAGRRRVTIAGEEDIPYRCLGHAIYLAQRAGFERIGFAAEPPPAPPVR